MSLLGSAARRAHRALLLGRPVAWLGSGAGSGFGGVGGSGSAHSGGNDGSGFEAATSSSTSICAPFWNRAAGLQAARTTFTAVSPTKLDEIMHVDFLADKSAEEIERIWLEFHEEKAAATGGGDSDGAEADAADTSAAGGEGQQQRLRQQKQQRQSQQRRVADTLGADEFKQLQARARSSPMFVLPLAKPGGFMTLVLNWQGPVALLTSLDEYRRLGAGAPPHMTVTCYPELAESKGLVLVRGDVISGHVVSAPEARTLLQLARAFYTDPGAHRFVYAFNHEPEKFSFDALLAELGLLKSGQGGNKSASGGESGGGSGESGGGGDSGGGGGAGV